MKKTLFILSLFVIVSCSKDCRYNKAQLDKMFESEIRSAGTNTQKIKLIIQKYNLKYKDAC
jgi:hypothetical protein